MGQKVNPISLRLSSSVKGGTSMNRQFDSYWFAENNYRQSLFEDINIRKYLKGVFHFFQKYPAKIIIRHFPHKSAIYGFFLSWNSFTKGFEGSFGGVKRVSAPRKKSRRIQSSFSSLHHKNFNFLFFSNSSLYGKTLSNELSQISKTKLSQGEKKDHKINSLILLQKTRKYSITPLFYIQSIIRLLILQKWKNQVLRVKTKKNLIISPSSSTGFIHNYFHLMNKIVFQKKKTIYLPTSV